MQKNRSIIVLFNVPEQHSLKERGEKLLSGLKNDGFSIEFLSREESRIKSLYRNIKGIIRIKPSVVYLIDFGYVTVIPALICLPFFSFRIVFDTGDIVYELFKSTGRSVISYLIARIIEPLVWRISSVVIVRGTYFEEYLRDKGYRNILLIPDGVDLELFRPFDTTDLRKRLRIEDKLTVGVVGSLNWIEKYNFCYGWELISALKFLKDLPVAGIIIGDGSGLKKLKGLAKEYDVEEKVLFLGRIPYEQLSKYINLMDICISTQSNDIVGNVRTTGKLPLYIACNKFILATKVGTAKYLLPEDMLIDYEGIKDETYPERLAEKIKRFVMNKDQIIKSINLREIAAKEFNYNLLAGRVKNIIEKLCDEAG